MVELVRSLDPKKLYSLEWPPGMLEAVQNGEATWKKYADGSLAVVLRDKDNKSFVKHLRLRESDVPFQSAAALSNMAVQAALADVVARLEEIDAKLERALVGARADRHGAAQGRRQVVAIGAIAERAPMPVGGRIVAKPQARSGGRNGALGLKQRAAHSNRA